jgi:anhydro-N-acetylmuramic acid kinase
MSGSSLDGLDMALCRMEESDGLMTWTILDAQTVSFPEDLFHQLKNAPTLSGFDLMHLDAEFGKYVGQEINKWILSGKLSADCIASHGHTVFHSPAMGFTTQIGSGAHIAFHTGIDTITTFRAADVAAGGQGAPFAPVADTVLFPGFDGYLNLGGIANVNLLTKGGQWKAWDIGPCNQALNHLARKSGQPFDKDGRIAASGRDIEEVIDALLQMYPVTEGQPKGLSNAEVQATWINYLDASGEKVEDLLASVSETISRMIMNHICQLIKTPSRILVTGGGTYNTPLLRHLEAMASAFDITLVTPPDATIQYKECLLMACLGYLTLHGKPYGIKNITGASADTIGGTIFKANR